MPFRATSWQYLKGLSFVLEYDSIPYQDETIEKHPKGRNKYHSLQLGLKYRAWDFIDFSFAYIRGEKCAFTVSTSYNFGVTKGLIPKIEDALPYKSPVNFQSLGDLRPPDVMIQEFIYTFSCQGFDICEAWLCDEGGQRILRLKVNNLVYRDEIQFAPV